MRQAQLAASLTNDAILYAFAASLAFLGAVILLDPMLRKSGIGKSLIMLDIGLAALYIPSVLHRFAGLQITQIGFAWYFLATVVTVGTAVWWRTLIMVTTQLRAARQARALQRQSAPGDTSLAPPGTDAASP